MSYSRSDERLIARFLDGEASSAEIARLQALARENPEVRRALEESQAIVEAGERLPVFNLSRDIVSLAERAFVDGRTKRRALRRFMIPAAVTVVVVALVAWFTGFPLRDSTPDAPVVRWVVTQTTGPVWILEAGQLRETAIGDLVTEGLRIRTGAGGSVTLTGPRQPSIEVDEETQVLAVGNEVDYRAMMLERGGIRARIVGDDTIQVALYLRGSTDRVEIQDGDIGVLNDGAGRITVACMRGVARIRAGKEEEIVLQPGLEVQAVERSWSTPRRIAQDLQLHVEKHVESDTVRIAGRVNPGAQIIIGTQSVDVDEEGGFTHRVPLPNRPLEITVSARDATWRKKQVQLTLAPGKSLPGIAPPVDSQWELEWEDTNPKKNDGSDSGDVVPG